MSRPDPHGPRCRDDNGKLECVCGRPEPIDAYDPDDTTVELKIVPHTEVAP